MYNANIDHTDGVVDDVAWATFTWDEFPEEERTEDCWFQFKLTFPHVVNESTPPPIEASASGTLDNPYWNGNNFREDLEYNVRVRKVYAAAPTTNFSEWSEPYYYTPNHT